MRASFRMLAYALGLLIGFAAHSAVHVDGSFPSPGKVELEDYLADSDAGYDQTLPRPESVLGHRIGARFARHDRVVAWFEKLAAASEQVELVDIGTTHEGRRQVTAIISSASNIRDLDALRLRHLDGDPTAPLFTWHGYSVHGNESSGLQASMVVAWHLASSRDPDVRSLLRKTVVMIDPSINPDGYGRFSSWANQTMGRIPIGEPGDRQRSEPWPGGRTNHYFFDLNRDWLLLQQPETRNRVAFYQRYHPHLMTDHHEMSAERTFFFQPGAPSRWNPLIPESNRTLTARLAEFHAAKLDEAQRLYYSEESYDDFYPGKGSTWPDLQGTVGILFEQAGTRGLVRDTAQGQLSLPVAISNHVLATLSTLEASLEMADELKGYRRAYLEGLYKPKGLPAGWIFDDGGDPGRAAAMLEVIKGQGLDVFGITEAIKSDGVVFEPGGAWVVPVIGPRAALAQSLFASTTRFEDSTFYDVSAWSLPHAFGVQASSLGRMPNKLDTTAEAMREYVVSGTRNASAWAMPWRDFFAPAALFRLQTGGVRTRVAMEAFSASSNGQIRTFDAGTIVVHRSDLPQDVTVPANWLGDLVAGDAPLIGLDGGLTSTGPDLGSPRVLPLQPSKVALLAGDGVSGYSAGSLWHMLDFRLGIPVSLIRPDRLDEGVLNRHTHLIMPSGEYNELSEEVTATLERWVEAGGVLIAARDTLGWLQEQKWLRKPDTPTRDEKRYGYGDMAEEDGRRQIGGSILEVVLDESHPLTFGLGARRIGLLRQGRASLKAAFSNPFTVAGVYSDDPLLNGFLPEGYATQIAGQPAILAVPKGGGVIVAFAEDPAFRGVWWIGQRLVSNAISFAEVVRAPDASYGPEDKQKEK